ncbi:hypothetical protein O181_040100 [Austropuccinia psidii MF-1]|uniref:DUF4939 domain-containing protein n=1 Tax=Austropuccinia psidii MF-1 TaxID=1389203 RepID=A0A9Q3DCL8_9BASI|nr:hypothetical protein [Austropuccinia psidii MF-1]
MSSRAFIKAQGQVSLSNINDAIRESLHILIQSIPQREYWPFLLKGFQEVVSKQFSNCQCSINPPWPPHSFNTVWIQKDLPGEDLEEEEENSVEGEESDGTEVFPPLVGTYQGIGGPTLSQSNQPVSHQSEPSLLAIMQQMTEIMPNLQEASSFEASIPPDFKTPSVKAPELFDETQPFKVRSFIQSFPHIFNNDQENFSEDRKKVLYSTSFLIGRAKKWIEPYLSNPTN